MEHNSTNILSFDGGGLKGIYQLIILNKLTEKYNNSSIGKTDLFLGTSIGGVIASSLAFGIEPGEIYAGVKHLLLETNNFNKLHENLMSWLKDKFRNKYFGEISQKVFLPVFDATDKLPTHFGYNSPIDLDNIPIWNVLLAICADIRIAAPVSFYKNGNAYYDGGIFAYDPVLFFLREEWNLNNPAKILSIGCGIIQNISKELNKDFSADIIYDALLTEQFANTDYFFRNLPAISPVSYQRISEFPYDLKENVTMNNIIELAEEKTKNLAITNGFFTSV